MDSLDRFLKDNLIKSEASDAIDAFYNSLSAGKGVDFEELTDFDSDGLDFDEDGNITFDNFQIDTTGLEDEMEHMKNPGGDGIIAKPGQNQGNMDSGDIKEAAREIVSMANRLPGELGPAILNEVYGDEIGALLWEEIVSTSILERVIPRTEKDGQRRDLVEVKEKKPGQGTEMWRKKHKVASSIAAYGKYRPGTELGISRSYDEVRYERRKKGGSGNFIIFIDRSSSNGSRASPSSPMNAVLAAACAIVQEAKALGDSVTLIVNPSKSGGAPDNHPLTIPTREHEFWTGDAASAKKSGGKTKLTKVTAQPDIDWKLYYEKSKDYDEILSKLVKIDSYGCEEIGSPAARMEYLLNKWPKKDKTTIIFLCDCTIPELYKNLASFWQTCEERDATVFLVNIGAPGTDMEKDMTQWVKSMDAKWLIYGVVPTIGESHMLNGKMTTCTPNNLAQFVAQSMDLKKVQISGVNALTQMKGY